MSPGGLEVTMVRFKLTNRPKEHLHKHVPRKILFFDQSPVQTFQVDFCGAIPPQLQPVGKAETQRVVIGHDVPDIPG